MKSQSFTLNSIHQPRITRNVVLLGMVFTTLLLLSNVVAFKIIEWKVWGLAIIFPAALLFFPLTYFFDNALTEVYGFKVSRLIIWGGLFCCAVFTLGSSVAVYLPASPLWNANTQGGDQAFAKILTGSARIFAASTLAYFCGEFLNSIILAKLKVHTVGKYFSLRLLASTVVGVGVDSSIFCCVAFIGVMPFSIIKQMIVTQFIFKVAYELAMLPVTIALINKLKKMGRVDHYDVKTIFNPFSIKLNN